MQIRNALKEEMCITSSYMFSPKEAYIISYDTDEALFTQGEKINWFMFVISGTADVQIHAANGGKLAFGYSISSGSLGEIELMAGSNISTTTVVATSPMKCLAVPYDMMKAELNKNIGFSNLLGNKIAVSFSELQQRYISGMLTSGEQRLAEYIKRKSLNGVFRNTLSDTASVIGVSYRHIFRMMGKLCSDGVLKKGDDGYHVVNEAALDDIISK